MSVIDVHDWWSWVFVVTNGLAGAWALAADRVERLRGRALWWFTGLAQATVVVQVLLGSWLLGVEDREVPEELHALYGYGSLVAVGIIYSYRSQLAHRIHLLYGGGGLFLMGMGIRSMVAA